MDHDKVSGSHNSLIDVPGSKHKVDSHSSAENELLTGVQTTQGVLNLHRYLPDSLLDLPESVRLKLLIPKVFHGLKVHNGLVQKEIALLRLLELASNPGLSLLTSNFGVCGVGGKHSPNVHQVKRATIESHQSTNQGKLKGNWSSKPNHEP